MARAPIYEHSLLLACRCARALERVFPVRIIWVLCWPAAAFLAVWQLTFAGPTFRQLDRLPAALRPRMSRPSWVAYLWQERTRINLARLMCLWPDRLSKERWADRCHRVGLHALENQHAQGRPVVLALLHFGPVILIGHWLRALGLPVAGLRRRSTAERSLFWKYIDRLSAPGGRRDVPIVFDLTDLRRALEHLQAGGILAAAVEGRHTRHVRLSGEGFAFDMAPGVFRLAAASGAVVMPCLITAGPRMSFTVHLGEPVPEELVIDENRHPAACDNLLREFLAVISRYPGQSHPVLIANFQPAIDSTRVSAQALSETAT